MLRRALLAAREARQGGVNQELESLHSRLSDALAWALGRPAGQARGSVVALYWPVRGEPGFGELPEQWTRAGLRLALPVVDARAAPLRFVAWEPGAPMCAGLFGIARPQSEQTLRPSVIFIPCVGFDHRGYRLGYGGGFYDRTLAALQTDGGPAPRTVGVAWDEGQIEGLDPLPTDVPLDLVVTPGGAHGPACSAGVGSR